MFLLHCWFLVFSVLTIKGINCQYYSQLNNRFYGNYKGNFNRNLNDYNKNYNNIYNNNYKNYNENMDQSQLRYQEAAVRPGELTVEVNEAQGQTPCRNKEANKDHKDTLWWTLPIPPMELEGPPEKPPQIKQEPMSAPASSGGGVETGAIQQQKHPQPAQPAGPAATTPKAQPAAPTQAVVQVATTVASKHEGATTQSSKSEKQKIAQMQKQQQQLQQQQQQQQQQQAAAAAAAAAAAQGQGQGQPAQQNVPAPTQLVVSNKESNNMQMLANKSVATMKAPNTGRNMVPIMQHGANKQKVMLNRMEPAIYQYTDSMGMPQGYVNYPYFNSPYLSEPQIMSNNYRNDMLQNSIAELADNMYKEFDTNDAEIGGGGIVGEKSSFSREGQQNLKYDSNLAPIQNMDVSNQWNLPEDERNKRNLQSAAVIS